MSRARIAANVELAFATLMVLWAAARPSLWHNANIARVVVLVEAGSAFYIAQGLRRERTWAWLGVFLLGTVGVVEAWYTSAAFVFSFMGEGMADRVGLALLMGTFALQAVVLVVWAVERLATPPGGWLG